MIIIATNQQNQKLAFTKTRETQTTYFAGSVLHLGIMPDYTFPEQVYGVMG